MNNTNFYKCIALYPNNKETNYKQKCEQYVELAVKKGFNEIFTSIHLPEISVEEQLEFLYFVSELSKKYNIDLTADIGGKYISELIKNKEALKKMQDIKLDFIRLDYGYKHDEVEYLNKALKLKGFVINASIYTDKESKIEIDFIRSLNKEVRACHNFYPREESGLDEELTIYQKDIFDKLNVPIYYCIPSLKHPRGPIYKGLPTLEEHRGKDITYVTLDLLNTYDAKAYMFSDEFYEEKDFDDFNDVVEHNLINITVKTYDSFYDRLVYRDHQFRYDSNKYFLRSQSSRQMAEFSEKIEPKNCVERKRGVITLDNIKNERYSGELQVVLIDAEANEKINVVGEVEINDLAKLNYYRNGYIYKFIK